MMYILTCPSHYMFFIFFIYIVLMCPCPIVRCPMSVSVIPGVCHCRGSFLFFYADGKPDYCNDFDLRKPLERHFLSNQRIDCFSLEGFPNLDPFRERCSTFLAQLPRYLRYLHLHTCNTPRWSFEMCQPSSSIQVNMVR